MHIHAHIHAYFNRCQSQACIYKHSYTRTYTCVFEQVPELSMQDLRRRPRRHDPEEEEDEEKDEVALLKQQLQQQQEHVCLYAWVCACKRTHICVYMPVCVFSF